MATKTRSAGAEVTSCGKLLQSADGNKEATIVHCHPMRVKTVSLNDVDQISRVENKQ